MPRNSTTTRTAKPKKPHRRPKRRSVAMIVSGRRRMPVREALACDRLACDAPGSDAPGRDAPVLDSSEATAYALPCSTTRTSARGLPDAAMRPSSEALSQAPQDWQR